MSKWRAFYAGGLGVSSKSFKAVKAIYIKNQLLSWQMKLLIDHKTASFK